MESIINAQRFICTNWKDLDTAFAVQSAVHADMYRFAEDTMQHKELKAMFYNLEKIIVRLSAATSDINRGASLRGEPILPRVAWMPEPVLNEETGIAVTPGQPELPEFASKAERCHYLKQLADAALEEKHEEPVVVEEKEVQVEEEGSDVNPSDQSAREQEVQSPAQAALSAIRSRRKKKD